jgi:hypothetical protein
MHDRINSRCREYPSQQLAIPDISLEKARPLASNLCHTIDNLDPAVREIIDDGHGVACRKQGDTGMRANVAATAGNQDIHLSAVVR